MRTSASIVEVPMERIVERIVEIEKPVIIEKLVHVPVEHVIERVPLPFPLQFNFQNVFEEFYEGA